jgi:RND family efflux transporter MFP subunit
MPLNRKAVAISLGLSAVLAAATVSAAQPQRPAVPQADGQTLIIDEASVDWILKSDVAALREGVIKSIELHTGKEADKGSVIGQLHDDVARLAMEEAKVAAESLGGLAKAQAQKDNAMAVVARNKRLLLKGSTLVSMEEQQKAEAELAIADGMEIEAKDQLRLAQAKLNSAKQAVMEHEIKAPFSGIVIHQFKHEGERVNANEAVVTLGNLDRVRVFAYVPVEYAYRVSVGTEIEIEPRLGPRVGTHPIEQKRFRGLITFVDPQIQPIAESAVRIYADIENRDKELKPGTKARMTIYLKPEAAGNLARPSAARTDLGTQTAELPPMPPR